VWQEDKKGSENLVCWRFSYRSRVGKSPRTCVMLSIYSELCARVNRVNYVGNCTQRVAQNPHRSRVLARAFSGADINFAGAQIAFCAQNPTITGSGCSRTPQISSTRC
jgi:hypothetical protein